MHKNDVNTPMYKLFVCFILDTINELPKEQIKLINSMNLNSVFKTNFDDWRLIIKKVLHLSDTIEIAIKDLWLKNSKIAYDDEVKLTPDNFAHLFIENFYKEDSKIDVWENNEELTKAKQNISNSYLSI